MRAVVQRQVLASTPQIDSALGSPSQRVDPLTIASACALLAAGWTAAGSLGLIGHPLRHALSWLCVIVALGCSRRTTPRDPRRMVAWAVGLAAGAVALTSTNPVVDALGVALVGLVLAHRREGVARSVLRCSTIAVAMLALWRHLYDAIPLVLLLADTVSRGIGAVGGVVAGKPLWVGASFAGLDYLIVMIAVLIALVFRVERAQRAGLIVYGSLGILAAHLLYLVLLAILPPWIGHPPPIVAPLPGQGPIGQAPELTWQQTGAYLIPWNLPALLAGLDLAVAAFIFRNVVLTADETPSLPAALRLSAGQGLRSVVFAIAAAALLPCADSLWLRHPNLEGKKIVFNKNGFLNWLRPVHGEYGRLGGGMYGMLPPYLETLGARPLISANFSDEDLNGAAAVVLLFPDERNPFSDEQLSRLDKFVRAGGTLVVVGDHTQHDTPKELPVGDRPHNQFNVVLGRMTSMYIPFDAAMFQIGGWLQSYEPIAHPTTIGMRDDRNQFGVVIGSSVHSGWRGQPLIAGRWGFAEPGDVGSEAAMMGNRQYDPGEKLGDLVLAAEQQVGRGRVIAFGDTSSFTNGINVGAHVFTSRFFGYIANGGGVARPLWRQFLALLLGAVILRAIWIHRSIQVQAGILVALAVSLTLCARISHARADVLPDGRRAFEAPLIITPNNLAYIETSNLEAQSGESWRPDGTAGLALTLMRNGYVTLQLPEITQEQLDRAGLLVSVAPRRPYTSSERAAIRRFIENGGTYILTADYGDHLASAELLSELGLWIGQPPSAAAAAGARPPEPMGHFKSPYIDTGKYMAFVRFHAAWPVGTIQADDPQARVIANGNGNVPVVILRTIGRGKAVVVGDTAFAMNKNLEWEDGTPFDGMRENSDFWRWFITVLNDRPMWIPPKPVPIAAPAGRGASPGTPNQAAPPDAMEAQ